MIKEKINSYLLLRENKDNEYVSNKSTFFNFYKSETFKLYLLNNKYIFDLVDFIQMKNEKETNRSSYLGKAVYKNKEYAIVTLDEKKDSTLKIKIYPITFKLKQELDGSYITGDNIDGDGFYPLRVAVDYYKKEVYQG